MKKSSKTLQSTPTLFDNDNYSQNLGEYVIKYFQSSCKLSYILFLGVGEDDVLLWRLERLGGRGENSVKTFKYRRYCKLVIITTNLGVGYKRCTLQWCSSGRSEPWISFDRKWKIKQNGVWHFSRLAIKEFFRIVFPARTIATYFNYSYLHLSLYIEKNLQSFSPSAPSYYSSIHISTTIQIFWFNSVHITLLPIFQFTYSSQ